MTFQLTFLETNVAELAGIVRLAAELGVDRVKGHHLWAHFREIESLSMRRSAESIARWNEAVLEGLIAVLRKLGHDAVLKTKERSSGNAPNGK